MKLLHIRYSPHLLQQIRLIHALAETDFKVVLPEGEQSKFQILKKYFDVDFLYGTVWNYDITDFLEVNHVKPLTVAFGIERPLIFPHAITQFCKSLWKDKRQYHVSFAGLLTEKRKAVIENWIDARYNKKIDLDNMGFASITDNFINKILGSGKKSKKIKFGDLLLWSTAKGREFPIKSWDNEYYEILSNTEFVLCPNGDYIWTYRFFESILCGAIPVVESNCDLYKDFRYYTLEDNLNDLKWRVEDALHNYMTCISKITIPPHMLNKKISESIAVL